MRIKIINPNTTEEMTKSIYQAACRVARADTEIVAVNPEKGPVSVESFHDEYAAALGVMEEMHKGVHENYDAFIIACYGDPGLYAAREIASAPVVGIAEASMYVASMLAAKFSIITDLARSRLGLEELVHRYGMTDKCASIRDSGIAVLGFGEDPSAGLRQLALLSRKAVEEDRAEAICLGCAGMVDFAAELEKELGVPVIDGVTAAVKMAESLVDLRKRTSKVLYFALPEKKEYKGFPDILQP